MILLGQRASTLVTARGDYPIPLTPVGNRGDCIEQLERARRRREARAYPILNPGPAVVTEAPAPKPARNRGNNGAQALRRFSVDEARTIAAEYQAGTETADLAARYGCAKSTIRRCLTESGVKPRHGGGGKSRDDYKRRAESVAAYLAGESTITIAARYGVDSRTVSRNVQAAGHELRSRSESYRLTKAAKA